MFLLSIVTCGKQIHSLNILYIKIVRFGLSLLLLVCLILAPNCCSAQSVVLAKGSNGIYRVRSLLLSVSRA